MPMAMLMVVTISYESFSLLIVRHRLRYISGMSKVEILRGIIALLY